jgi:hypothetical protein
MSLAIEFSARTEVLPCCSSLARCAIHLTGAFKNGDVLTVGMDLANGILRFSRNGIHLGEAFSGLSGPLVAVVTQASEESKVTIQNRPTVLNMGEYTGELR